MSGSTSSRPKAPPTTSLSYATPLSNMVVDPRPRPRSMGPPTLPKPSSLRPSLSSSPMPWMRVDTPTDLMTLLTLTVTLTPESLLLFVGKRTGFLFILFQLSRFVCFHMRRARHSPGTQFSSLLLIFKSASHEWTSDLEGRKNAE